MQVSGICTVLCHIHHYVLNSKGIDEPSMLRSDWYCYIRRDLSRWSFFWLMILPNISGCLKLKQCIGLANNICKFQNVT